MMSVTAIIQGAQSQHWGRTLAGFGNPHVSLGKLNKKVVVSLFLHLIV